MESHRSTDFISKRQPRRVRRSRTRVRTISGLLGLAVVVLGCGSDVDDTNSEALPLSVEGLLEAEPSGTVNAVGFVVIDSAGAQLCFALAESFPPQCGRPSVEIVNPDDLDVAFEESGDVRWTDQAVVVRGEYSSQAFTIAAPVS